MVYATSGWAIFGSIVGSLALLVGAINAWWNIHHARAERSAQRSPDVHGVLVNYPAPAKNSELVFANLGPSMARHLMFLLLEGNTVHQAGVSKPFLAGGDQVRTELPFRSTAVRSTFVWAYMDRDHNVHAKSNDGGHYVYEQPTRVEIGQVFQRFYPKISLPSRPTIQRLGEL